MKMNIGHSGIENGIHERSEPIGTNNVMDYYVSLYTNASKRRPKTTSRSRQKRRRDHAKKCFVAHFVLPKLKLDVISDCKCMME